MKDFTKAAGFFVAGTLFGAFGLKLFASQDAKKVYVRATAAGLRVKDQVMNTVTSVQENASDILAEAKELNAERAAQEAAAEAEAQILDEDEVQVETEEN